MRKYGFSVLALLLLTDPPPDSLAGRVRRRLPVMFGVILLSRFLVDSFGFDLQYYLLLAALFLLSIHLFAMPRTRHIPGIGFLCATYIVWFTVSIYMMWFNRGLLPKTTLFAYMYVSQLAVVLYLTACMYCVNCRFARKFAQADMLVEKLDALVEERTAQLVAQENARRGMMVNIFHDLRSPLFAARGCAEMMRAQDGESGEYLDVIRSKLDFLTELSEQLFLVAKLEDQQITFAREAVDLAALCGYIAQEMGVEAQDWQFAYEQSTAPPVMGDAFRLKQAIGNLLSNAVKFTKPGGRIALSLFEAESMAAICVRDTGSGISDEDLPHVFDRYYHGKNSDKQRSTGLGLAIAHEIVRAHGGRIEVTSRLGEGTAFTVLLPPAQEE